MVSVLGLRRRIPGVRALVLSLVSLAGTLAAFVVPTLVAFLVSAPGWYLGIGSESGPGLWALPAGISVLASATGMMHLVGVGLERAWRLRSPWGQLGIGTDGVRWDGWVRRRFAAWAEIQGVVSVGDGLALHLKSGERVTIHPADVAAAATALAAARAAHDASERAAVPAGLGADRDPRRWLDRVRGLGFADYRGGGAPADVLLRVAEDPAAPPLARVGSALALAKDAGRERARVRVALEDLADDDVRAAMEAALDDRLTPAQVRELSARTP